MRSTLECLAKAAELSRLADNARSPEIRVNLLAMAQAWVDLSYQAEWQDTHFSPNA